MDKTKLQTLKGFRDFLPQEKRKRDYVALKIKETFELYGFEPLETPTLEYAELLLGKYGDEADKLVYTFEDRGGRKLGLRYDQTVPTARVLGQYSNTLPKGFRRYQIQNVFRADKPQKGRFREFTQCDPDIFGSTSPIADAEIIAVTYAAFKNVGFPTVILKINDRQTLFEVLEKFELETVSVFSIIQTIDKLDKKSESEVLAELQDKGLTAENATQALKALKNAQPSKNLKEIMELSVGLGVPSQSLEFTPFLARGLDYYTGMIFEVIIPEYPLGSFGGGGRYDNLIKQLGGPDIPAVGIAFGFDRMVEAAENLNIIPSSMSGAKVLVTIFDDTLKSDSVKAVRFLRENKISSEIFPDDKSKLDKQLKYANQKSIPYAVIIGPEEVKDGKLVLKNLKTGEQTKTSFENLVSLVK